MSPRQVFLSFLSLVVLLVIVILGRSLMLRSVQPEVESPAMEAWAEGDAALSEAAGRFSKSIQIAPVTYEDRQQIKPEQFLAFFDSLSAWYPGIHRVVVGSRQGTVAVVQTGDASGRKSDGSKVRMRRT